VLSPRAEGPSVSSPARQGGVFKTPPETRSEGPALRRVAPSGLLLNARLIPALRPGLVSVGPSGLNCQIVTVIANSSTKTPRHQETLSRLREAKNPPETETFL
jgi:hypothetical protein